MPVEPNMRFGGYSFTIKVVSAPVPPETGGTVLSSYAFAKRVNISLLYDVDMPRDSYPDMAGVPDTGFQPRISYFDIPTGTWKYASDTCDPPFEEIDYKRRLYTVSICHLTQFGVFHQLAPVVRINPLPTPEDPDWQQFGDMSATRLAPRAAAALTPVASPLPLLINRPLTSFPLDASNTYDADGWVRFVRWSLVAAPPRALAAAAAVAASIPNGTLSAMQVLEQQVLRGSGGNLTASVTPTVTGFWSWRLQVRDEQDAEREGTFSFVYNTPPRATLSRRYYAAPSVAAALSASTDQSVAPGTETSPLFLTARDEAPAGSIVLDGSSSGDDDDIDGDVISAVWSTDDALFSSWARPRPMLIPVRGTRGTMVLLGNAEDGAFPLTFTVTDRWNVSRVAKVLAGLPFAVDAGATQHQLPGAYVTLSAAYTVLHGGDCASRCRFNWTAAAWPTAYGTAAPIITLPNSVTTPLADRLWAVGEYIFTVTVTPPAYLAAPASRNISVWIHEPAAAAVTHVPFSVFTDPAVRAYLAATLGSSSGSGADASASPAPHDTKVLAAIVRKVRPHPLTLNASASWARTVWELDARSASGTASDGAAASSSVGLRGIKTYEWRIGFQPDWALVPAPSPSPSPGWNASGMTRAANASNASSAVSDSDAMAAAGSLQLARDEWAAFAAQALRFVPLRGDGSPTAGDAITTVATPGAGVDVSVDTTVDRGVLVVRTAAPVVALRGRLPAGEYTFALVTRDAWSLPSDPAVSVVHIDANGYPYTPPPPPPPVALIAGLSVLGFAILVAAGVAIGLRARRLRREQAARQMQSTLLRKRRIFVGVDEEDLPDAAAGIDRTYRKGVPLKRGAKPSPAFAAAVAAQQAAEAQAAAAAAAAARKQLTTASGRRRIRGTMLAAELESENPIHAQAGAGASGSPGRRGSSGTAAARRSVSAAASARKVLGIGGIFRGSVFADGAGARPSGDGLASSGSAAAAAAAAAAALRRNRSSTAATDSTLQPARTRSNRTKGARAHAHSSFGEEDGVVFDGDGNADGSAEGVVAISLKGALSRSGTVRSSMSPGAGMGASAAASLTAAAASRMPRRVMPAGASPSVRASTLLQRMGSGNGPDEFGEASAAGAGSGPRGLSMSAAAAATAAFAIRAAPRAPVSPPPAPERAAAQAEQASRQQQMAVAAARRAAALASGGSIRPSMAGSPLSPSVAAAAASLTAARAGPEGGVAYRVARSGTARSLRASTAMPSGAEDGGSSSPRSPSRGGFAGAGAGRGVTDNPMRSRSAGRASHMPSGVGGGASALGVDSRPIAPPAPMLPSLAGRSRKDIDATPLAHAAPLSSSMAVAAAAAASVRGIATRPPQSPPHSAAGRSVSMSASAAANAALRRATALRSAVQQAADAAISSSAADAGDAEASSSSSSSSPSRMTLRPSAAAAFAAASGAGKPSSPGRASSAYRLRMSSAFALQVAQSHSGAGDAPSSSSSPFPSSPSRLHSGRASSASPASPHRPSAAVSPGPAPGPRFSSSPGSGMSRPSQFASFAGTAAAASTRAAAAVQARASVAAAAAATRSASARERSSVAIPVSVPKASASSSSDPDHDLA